ncbi:unnamed protein product [Caenorhabditis angaria]|uniref:BTB domain-containing protein n=1 Tax=Caenorhabditis angaria TaxID=860376 RepID=A0A9P1IE79_9PELO|nr:unnamed protein product [Caenorhabditis angaria]
MIFSLNFAEVLFGASSRELQEDVEDDLEILEIPVEEDLKTSEVIGIPVQTSDDSDRSEALESALEVQEESEDQVQTSGESTEVTAESNILEVKVETSEESTEGGDESEALEPSVEVQEGSEDQATSGQASGESTEVIAGSKLLEVPVQASGESTEVRDGSEALESDSEVQEGSEDQATSGQASEDSTEVTAESEVLEVPVQASEESTEGGDRSEGLESASEVQASLDVPVQTSGDPTEVQKSSEVSETSTEAQADLEVLVQTSEASKVPSEVLEIQVQTSEDPTEVQETPDVPIPPSVASEAPQDLQHHSPPAYPLLKISIPTDLSTIDQQDSGLPPEPDFLLPDWNLPDITTSTHCSFIKSESRAKCRRILPLAASLPRFVAPAIFVAEVKKIAIVPPKKRKVLKKMAAEVIHQNEPHCFSTTNVDRPFKLLVQKETFLIDADSMSRISPIFNLMCFGKDFEKMDLSREIVDEKSKDIDCFLRAVHDTSTINSSNFALVLRLSNKYQVETIIEACQQFILRQQLEVLKPDEILTMLIAAYEHHCQKDVVQKLIRRLASEGNTVFTKLRISRFLPAQVYGSVISTSMNLNQVREHETMNGHVLKLERSKTRWRQSVCDECKSVSECANCEECKKSYCRRHVADKKCSNDYGLKLLADLKKKIVDFEWTD